MKRVSWLLFLPLLAMAPSMPHLTRERLVGVWEAAMTGLESGMGIGIYRMEIRGNSDGYMIAVMAGGADIPERISTKFACRMTDSDLKDGKVKLRFRSLDKIDPDREFVIEGSAVGEANAGSIVGKLSTMRSRYFPDHTQDIWFKKGTWTREFSDASTKAERYLQKRRTEDLTNR